MALIRWDPFRDLLSIQERMNRLFDDTLARSRNLEEGTALTAWAPPVDIIEKEKEITLTAELPGMKKDDIKVEVKEGVLTLSGERTMEKEVKEENYHRNERTYGRFQRSFTLPSNIKQEGMKASYEDGLLSISLPKEEEKKAKQISIEIK